MSIGLFIDIGVVVVVFISVAIAVLRGFIRESLTVLGLVGGAIASYIGGPLLIGPVSGWLGVSEDDEAPDADLFGFIPYELAATGIAYAIVFFVFVCILSIISYFLTQSVRNMGLGAADRALGAVFGLARAALVLGLLYLLPYLLITDDEQKAEWFEDSHTQVYLEASAGWIYSFVKTDDEGEGDDTVTADSGENVNALKDIVEGIGILPNSTAEDGQDTEEIQEGYQEGFRKAIDGIVEKVQEELPEVEAPVQGQYND